MAFGPSPCLLLKSLYILKIFRKGLDCGITKADVSASLPSWVCAGSGEDTVPAPCMPEWIKMHFCVISHILYPVNRRDMNKATLACCGRFLPLCRRRTVKALCLIKRKTKKKEKAKREPLYSEPIHAFLGYCWEGYNSSSAPVLYFMCALVRTTSFGQNYNGRKFWILKTLLLENITFRCFLPKVSEWCNKCIYLYCMWTLSEAHCNPKRDYHRLQSSFEQAWYDRWIIVQLPRYFMSSPFYRSYS